VVGQPDGQVDRFASWGTGSHSSRRAASTNSPRGLGRVRLGVVEDARAASLQKFLLANVEPGSRIISDGWASYPKATKGLYTLKATNVTASGRPAHEALPGVHLVFSLVKRWVMGTLHGSISPEHVQAYFDEWVFRFNRRNSASRRRHHRSANGCFRAASNANRPACPGATRRPWRPQKSR
jgi:hypothetical protein